MASGFGVNGTTGRCFPFIQDFVRCMSENESPLDETTGCRPLRDDYLECLHRTKEGNRLLAIRKEAYEQKLRAAGHDDHQRGGGHH